MMGDSNGIERTLGKILSTQEHIIGRIEDFAHRLEAHIQEDKHLERRLDAIEHRLSYATGITVAVIGVFSLVSSFLLKKLGIA